MPYNTLRDSVVKSYNDSLQHQEFWASSECPGSSRTLCEPSIEQVEFGEDVSLSWSLFKSLARKKNAASRELSFPSVFPFHPPIFLEQDQQMWEQECRTMSWGSAFTRWSSRGETSVWVPSKSVRAFLVEQKHFPWRQMSKGSHTFTSWKR